jgi:hypothetical protein
MEARRPKLSAMSDELLLGQGNSTSALADLRDRAQPSPFHLSSLLDLNAEVPYSTIVERLEEFLYQSELSQT